MGFSVTLQPSPTGVVSVDAAGEVDLLTASVLEQAIVKAVAAVGGTGVVVDLAGVTFLDSSGISVLLEGRRMADNSAKSYRVDGARGIVLQVLELTGVWEHLARVA